MRHIALVGPAHPYRGGIAHFTDNLASALRKRGHDVDIHTFSRQYPEFLFPGTSQMETSLDKVPGGTTARIDSVNPLTWIQEAQRIAHSGARLAVFAYWLPFFAPAYAVMAWLLRRRGIAVFAIVHNALPHKRHPADAALSRLLFRLCDRLIVLSSSVAEAVRTLDVSTPVTLAHHPVYEQFGERVNRQDARKRLDVDSDAPLILFFGFVRRYKGLHVLIEALPEVVRSIPDVQLIVAGEFYEDEDELRRRVKELSLEEHVRFDAEYIPEENVGSYFSAADVVVQPYVSATQSGVAHIAFHFGIPLIVTDVGALAEVVPDREAGLVVPPNDPAELATAIITYFNDKSLRAQLAEGVQARRRQYSWDGLCEIIEGHQQDIEA